MANTGTITTRQRLNLHEWVDMFHDVLKPGPLWLRLKHLWAPPEWRRPETTTAAEAHNANA